MKKIIQILIGTYLLSSLLTSACSKPTDTTPTLSPETIQTQAVATFSTGLTQTAAAIPTNTPTLTPTITPTDTPTATDTPQLTSITFLPTSSCYSLGYLKDVTIPDNSKMNPGEKFTKTWRVKNTGSCNWEPEFKLSLISGNAMGGSSYILSKDIESGSEIDISIEMTAPKTAGVYTGNWRMTNTSGVYFGDNVYVLIAVEGDTNLTSTPSKTPTTASAAPTATLTPTVDEPPTDTPEP